MLQAERVGDPHHVLDARRAAEVGPPVVGRGVEALPAKQVLHRRMQTGAVLMPARSAHIVANRVNHVDGQRQRGRQRHNCRWTIASRFLSAKTQKRQHISGDEDRQQQQDAHLVALFGQRAGVLIKQAAGQVPRLHEPVGQHRHRPRPPRRVAIATASLQKGECRSASTSLVTAGTKQRTSGKCRIASRIRCSQP